MSTKRTYGDKLLDPRWQKKRLRILERDDWGCSACPATDRTLHVHHHYYAESGDPWDVPDEALITLCADCHESEPAARRDAEADLLAILRHRGFLAMEIAALASAFADMADAGDSRALCAVLDVLRYRQARFAALRAMESGSMEEAAPA